MAIYYNIEIDQGSDYTNDLVVEDAAGNIADLTGYIATGQIRKTYTSITAYEITCTITMANDGEVRMRIPNAITSVMKPGRYVYDIEVRVGVDGDKTRVVEGQVEVTPGVTR